MGTKLWANSQIAKLCHFPRFGKLPCRVKQYFHLHSVDSDSDDTVRQPPRSGMFLQMFPHKVMEKLTISLMSWSPGEEKSLEVVFSEGEYGSNENSLHQVAKSSILCIIVLRIDQETPSFLLKFRE